MATASRLGKSAALLAAVVTLVGSFEGLREYAYRDPVGVPTVCFGETRGVHLGDHYTATQCKQMLGTRLQEFSKGVDACLHVNVPDKSYAAFVSFAYNAGVGAFCGSTLARKANAGNLVGACNELPKWVTAHGVTLPGLVSRRAEEQALCLEGAGVVS